MKRSLAIFLCAAGAILALATLKALVISGLGTLPPVRVLVFASSTFAMIAALLDWAVLRDLFPSAKTKAERLRTLRTWRPGRTRHRAIQSLSERAFAQSFFVRSVLRGRVVSVSMAAYRLVRHNFPGPAFVTSRVMHRSPSSCSGIAGNSLAKTSRACSQGTVCCTCSRILTGANHSIFSLSCEGPNGWLAGLTGATWPSRYLRRRGGVPSPDCSPRIAKERRKMCRAFCQSGLSRHRRLLILLLQGSPMPARVSGTMARTSRKHCSVCSIPRAFRRPRDLIRGSRRRASFRASRTNRSMRCCPRGAATALERRRTEAWSAAGISERAHRGGEVRGLRDEAAQRYEFAAMHAPAARVNNPCLTTCGAGWEGLEPVLGPGWGSLMEECVNVSLGLEREAAAALPADLVAACADRHRLASAYLHDEYPDHGKPEALARWESRKAEGSLKEVRSVHAACPNHMFGTSQLRAGLRRGLFGRLGVAAGTWVTATDRPRVWRRRLAIHDPAI